MLLPLKIRARISSEETLYGDVCNGKQHAVHPGHHHQPYTNHRKGKGVLLFLESFQIVMSGPDKPLQYIEMRLHSD